MRATHAGAVAFRLQEGVVEYVIISSSTGHEWVLPKGHIEHGEKPDAAALRELREETGVVGELVKPLGDLTFFAKGSKTRVLFYLVRAIGTVELTEQRSVRWLSYTLARHVLTFDEQREMLDTAQRVVEDLP